MRCTFYMLELQGLLESNSSPIWPYNDPWYGYSAVQCLQSEREALEGFLAWQRSAHSLGEWGHWWVFCCCECVCMCVCICECVGFYVRVGFFIVLGGYGFGKANLGLRAMGPCQAHQPISYAIRYRTTTACMHTCTNMHPPPPPFPSMSTVIHSSLTSAMTHCTLEPVAACMSQIIPITKLLYTSYSKVLWSTMSL